MKEPFLRWAWGPFIGFAFGGYIVSMFVLPIFGKTPAPMSLDMVAAVGGILGVHRWFRGQAQVEEVKKG